MKCLSLPELHTRTIGHPTYFIHAVSSTQDELKANADKHQHGTTLFVDHQTKGRGRRGRQWVCLPGEQLFSSILVRPRLSPNMLPMCTLALGLAIIHALQDLSVSLIQFKWPNDIYLNGNKVAGVLGELLSNEGAPNEHTLILGMGINLQGTADEIPIEFRSRTTTLEIHGHSIHREKILAHVLNHFEVNLRHLEDRNEPFLIHQINESWIYRNRSIIVELLNHHHNGVARDISLDGSLMLELPDGSLKAFRSGEVHHLHCP